MMEDIKDWQMCAAIVKDPGDACAWDTNARKPDAWFCFPNRSFYVKDFSVSVSLSSFPELAEMYFVGFWKRLPDSRHGSGFGCGVMVPARVDSIIRYVF